MERHEILEAMSELKLYGMRASFDEVAGKGLTRRDEIYPLIASLIRAEPSHIFDCLGLHTQTIILKANYLSRLWMQGAIRG
jgi:hypothetical protein